MFVSELHIINPCVRLVKWRIERYIALSVLLFCNTKLYIYIVVQTALMMENKQLK